MAEKSPAPQRDRPILPDGYGLPQTTDGMLAWANVESKLIAATNYWLATERPNGNPHAISRWGVWLDGRFWYDGAPTTVHARNSLGRWTFPTQAFLSS